MFMASQRMYRSETSSPSMSIFHSRVGYSCNMRRKSETCRVISCSLESFFVFFAFRFAAESMIGQQAAADAFKKKSLSPRSTGKTDVKRTLFSAFESPNDFLWRGNETETARQIIGRTKWKNTQRNAAVDQSGANFPDRTVSTCSENEIGGFSQSFFVIALFGRLISGVMSGFGQRRHQLLFAVLGISGLRIMHQCDSHALFTEILSSNYSAKTTLTLVSY